MVSNSKHQIPAELEAVREQALKALGDLVPAGPPASNEEGHGMVLSSRTDASSDLPPYYLVYFLLVDLLRWPNLGEWEKTAWMVPVRFNGRIYGIEHRKSGVGIFSPNLEPTARRSVKPTDQNEEDAREICKLINRAVACAEPYFEWRAEQAIAGTALNVVNRSAVLRERFEYFRDRYEELRTAAEQRKREQKAALAAREPGSLPPNPSPFPTMSEIYRRGHEAEWNAQAAVEAFFGWTEHAFIHIAILLGRALTGDDAAKLVESDWKTKYKAAMDLSDPASKRLYDALLDIRAQMRNFIAHGAFGKSGQAFSFHSGAGAAPVLVTHRLRHRYSLTGKAGFNEMTALETISEFLHHLWTGPRAPARLWLESTLPTILSYASDGTYAAAMSSDDDMELFVKEMSREFDRAANMDF